LHSPYLIKGMHEGVARIREAVSRNEKVGIFADSDVDGLTSLTILVNLLERIGLKIFYRFAVDDEEYGLRKEVIEEMRENSIDLIITLDCGIRDIDEINYAKELGIDVIVCDHHEQKSELPSAIIINPKLWDSNYPFKELAGVGVTFKLCHGILMSYLQTFNKLFLLITEDEGFLYISYIRNGIVEKISRVKDLNELNFLNDGLNSESNIIIFDSEYESKLRNLIKDVKIYNFYNLLSNIIGKNVSRARTIDDLCDIFLINKKVIIKKHELVNKIFSEIEYNNSLKIIEYLNSVIDLVSIGTVADIMPVYGENRTLIYYGLKSLNSTNHPGLSILIKKISTKITSKKIAWEISPLLNTPGRFGKSNLIAEFFLTKEIADLNSVINEITRLNDERKKIINELYNEFIKEIINDKHIAGKNLIFIASEKVPEGLCGLLANRIADTTNKPVIIISLLNNKELVKGSGRTMKNLNFFSFVEASSYLFERIGGHQQAFGFTIHKDKIENLKEKIMNLMTDQLNEKTEYNIDLDIPLECINYDFINSLNLLEPFGHQNEECLFLTRNAELNIFKKFGKNNNHGKYIFNNNKKIEAIGWNMAEIMEKHMLKKKVDIIYKLENNYFNGKYSPRMLIVDLD